jgi:hypothetical protein
MSTTHRPLVEEPSRSLVEEPSPQGETGSASAPPSSTTESGAPPSSTDVIPMVVSL